MSTDPREVILRSPMTRFQIWAVAITIGLNALDGFDVLSISFASPGIAKEWGIDRAALGVVLSMELFGMAAGSIFLGGVADKIGRRPTILGCLVVMALGMFLCTIAGDVYQLSAYRLMTGLGIGGMLAAINAIAAEYSSEKRRDLAVSLMAIGYPLGAVIGGSIAAVLLRHFEWRAVFTFGALISAAFIPLVLWRVPESVAFLVQRRPANALGRINAILARMGHPPVSALPDPVEAESKASLSDIFKPGLIGVTAAVTTAYLLHITTFYFILKWIPKIVTDMGFEPSSAASVLVWANVGGATGGAIFGFLTQRYGLKGMTVAVLAISTVMVAGFGQVPADLKILSLVVAASGLFTNAGVVGLYAIVARAFPTHVRATGTGFVVGLGRGGSALAPVIAGYLFQSGLTLPTVAAIMSVGSVIGACALATLKLRPRPAAVSR